ncbi:hypothetical protein SPI_05630 [Niveomyces insectorum RCEF 264]|uniref:Bactericidal permeability-increasing protein, alpha/beta domain protein n=1 Tax=Niveomyces insectorum RCEF 264 TaxID=1081102 RepID=A0A167TDZ5_9HYPO|nr:hypothetical protein SPI_05630 [Niveomyces insectorum RCEF 264]
MASPSVNRPTNVKQRDENIDRKLQLYGIASALGNGKLPSNDQVDGTLNRFVGSKALSNPSERLSADGRTLVADLRDVVIQAKKMLLSKNQGNLLQDFIWQTSHFDYRSVNVSGEGLPDANARQDGQKALDGLKTLGGLVITNGEFRKLLKDASYLFWDVLADSAAKASSKVRPPEDAMARIDEPAGDNVWHDKPNFSKESFKQQARGVYKKDQPAGASGNDAEAATSEAQMAAQDKSAEYRRRAREYMRSKIPPERKDQVVWRLKAGLKMVVECQQHQDYQQAVETLLDLAEKYQGHARTAGSKASGAVEGTRSRLSQAEADLKTLVERFANGTSTDDFWDSINAFYVAADKDDELRAWFKDLDGFIRRSLREKGYVFEDASTDDWNQLSDRGNYFFREKYRPQADRVTDQVKFLAEQFEQDPLNKAFGQSMAKLFNDLGKGENGKVTFKPHLVKDLTNVILPAALQSLAYVPIPRIEYADPRFDAVFDNLVFESDNFMPNMFEVYNNNYMSWGRKLAKAGANQHGVQVNVSGIQMDLRNASYYIKKKQGMLTLMDLGIFSVYLAGQGFGFSLKLSTADARDPQHFFRVDKVHVDIDHLKVTLHKSRHKLLFNLFKPILLRALRPTLQGVLETTIRDNFNKWDAKLYQIKKDADRAGEEASGDPDASQPNSYSRFFNAAKNHYDANREKKKAQSAEAKKAGKDKKINLAVTKEDSIFPNINLPGGFSSKATEYREMARKGDAWESPVFTLWTASTSKDIPEAPKIERKAPPPTNGTQANGANGINGVNGVNGNRTNGLNAVNGVNAHSLDPTAVNPAAAAPAVGTSTGPATAAAPGVSKDPLTVDGLAQGGVPNNIGAVSSATGRPI